MQPFEWKFPTHIVFGPGKFSGVHKLVKGMGRRALLISSKSFAPGGSREALAKSLTGNLHAVGIETESFYEIEANPRVDTVDRAAKLARAFKPRFLIALGGGSVMDAAKGIALLTENEGSIWDYAYRGPGQDMRHFNYATPIVAIPTVAATSSETDLYAVVTNAELHRKVTVFGESLIPKLAVIDPELTYTVPAAQTVDGAFDVINHVMESYLSTASPAHFQDRLTEAVVETVVWALPRALENPKDAEARSNLSWCAALALSGVFNGRDGGWPIHALEHGLSAYTDVAHGRGLSCLLPRIMQFDAQAIGDKIAHFNRKIFGTPSLRDGLEAYMKRVGAWTTIPEIIQKNSFNGTRIGVDTLIDKTIEHAFEIKPLLKRGEEPYLDNIKRIYKADAQTILRWCCEDTLPN